MSKISIFIIISLLILSTGCSTKGSRTYTSYSSEKNSYSPVVNKKDYSHPTMRPYVIRGIRYYPTVVNVGDEFKGNASWYGSDFHGKLTSNGETYNMYDMTAAHKTLPMNTIVKVTNLKNGLNTVVRINDRGPFIATRIIDLSNTAARKIDMIGAGTAPVKIEVLGFHSKGQKHVPIQQELKKIPQDQGMNGFALQIASFSRFEGALTTQKKYDNTDGYNTVIKDVETQRGRIFKVWLKGFRSEAEARDYLALGNFKDSFIVRED
ncbi:septal ring lytic transglycosylase RlpA family protein [Sulfurimonas sp.]|uniref:septal ring lytic transglycosylase RlpA family protein n=1 Tax=Sulfurimonas sp. TaxID=2022749 RepID=UPI0025F6277D|nr:septal ring lytic transglycosylase RlpA family protein [Sulfurimonas sp.]MBW6487600.1 septal ring lytic transglycosylase RlpA family protein [Sulfurimonas sp.]